jgi:hypothetical protein
MALVWASLALCIVLSTLGLVIAFRHGLVLFRDVKRSGPAFASGLDHVARSAEQTATRAAVAGAAVERVEPSLARLRVSLARLAVLRAAVDDVQAVVGRATALYPRK